MPQNAFNKTLGRKRNDGPALLMTKADHKKQECLRGRGE